MKKFISFSGGVESTTMCLLFGGTADAIWADTGWEHKPLYDRIPLVEEAVRAFHNNDFKIHVVKNAKYESLPEYIRLHKYYPSFRERLCTGRFKIDPIDDFLKQYKEEGAELMIGLNADEADARTGNHGLLPFVQYSYPLIDNGITRAKCEELLNAAGLHPNFPPYMKRGGCIGCYFKGKKEFRALLKLVPEEYNEVMELEEVIQDGRLSFFAVTNVREGLRKFKEKEDAQTSLFTPEEEYSLINDATPCGAFCHR